MGYRLEQGESAGEGVRRAALEQAEDARDQLMTAKEESGTGEGLNVPDSQKPVHEARKAVKRLRALARLGRAGLGCSDYERTTSACRIAAHALAPLRDADVMTGTLADLERRTDGDEARPALAAAREILQQGTPNSNDGSGQNRHDPQAAIAAAEAALSEAHDVISGWRLDDLSFPALTATIHRTYRRARKRTRDIAGEMESGSADSTGPAEELHELRKRVKDLGYIAQFLRPVWPKGMRRLERQCTQVEEQIGVHHDLTVLRETLLAGAGDGVNGCGAAAILEPLITLIDQSRAELAHSAVPVAQKLFSRKPRKLTGKLQRKWKRRNN